jgi:glucosyl-3-phosphoglycerate synthase
MKPYRLLLALTETNHLDAWIQLAMSLIPENGEIHLRGMVSVPEGKSLSEGAVEARQWRDALDPRAQGQPSIHEQIGVYVDYQPMARLLQDLSALEIDLLLVEWDGIKATTGGISTDSILQHAACDVVLVHGHMWQRAGSVFLSLRGGPNVSLGMRLARALAREDKITLFHAADNSRVTPDMKPLLKADPRITRTVTGMSGALEGIMDESGGHKVIILGATFRQPQAEASAAASLIEPLQEKTNASLVLVRTYHPEALEFHAPRWPLRTEETLSNRVDRWFAENTFHHNEFADLSSLMALKEKQGITISLGLPALNEEETVGKVIQTLKTALMDTLPLVDEIILIDSDSTDGTVAIAEASGIPVYRHAQILPEVGSYRGKGEALWKSLHVLKGDIVAWVDTDITNITPHFVYGLLGPLLKRPQVQYVKGFYRRPIKVGEKMQAYGGGRVTELVVRPLFNLFYPELSGLIQPLSGEYAGRRAALEHTPFFSGYGVETGLIIDLLDAYGLDGIAQTDLEVRVHHNQPLESLSKMSFAILQVFIARLEGRYGVQLLDKANHSMKMVVHEPERFALEIAEIADQERPPIVTIPAYRARFKDIHQPEPELPGD